ncbi:hypothetical protein HO133_005253 [Letharia lupina]|uniref:Uncharacterized protein n=1 Tax=Letharia lupina TaxID=560253 RepID=A0A8H6C8S5_9LECA|nr:uncharacterized protein HO133_005253 [Letharia lupina]KAF6218711.1 hypothetical protein HO133_005253 [Letharia lupina]
MVKLQPDNSLEVTGIFARDEAVFAPKFVNCEPSGWLWAYNVDGHVDEDGSLPWPYEVEGANNLPLHQSNKSSSFSSRNVLDLSTRVWHVEQTHGNPIGFISDNDFEVSTQYVEMGIL